MKRLVPIVMVLSLSLWFGCSSDDDDDGGGGGGGGVVLVSVIADTTVAPNLDSVNDAAWDNVTAKTLEVSGQNSPKIGGDQMSAATAVDLQAILKADTLYLRMTWADPTNNVWRDIFRADSFIQVGQDSLAIAHFKPVTGAEEDQLFVMFAMPDLTDWDVWNWRALTTAPGGLAEGSTLKRDGLSWGPDTVIIGIDTTVTPHDTTIIVDQGVVDTLVLDVGNLTVAYSNPVAFGQPSWMHTNGPAFSGNLLLLDDLIDLDARAGWQRGDTLPGWYIDSSFNKDNPTRPPSVRGSRFDIKAVSSHDSGIYTVVLSRALNSFGDDLDMSGLSQVKVKIGLYDNQSRFMTGSGNRGFTAEFWLVLP